MSGELNHDRSPVVLDSDKGVLSRPFLYSTSAMGTYFCYPGPHKMWVIAVRPQITIDFILKFYLYLNMRDRCILWHATLSSCLSPCFVLMRFCTLNWVTEILMQSISNVHESRRFPNPGLHELDKQSQPSRRGRHSWELQDQSLTFCEWFGIASIFSKQSLLHALDRFSATCDRAAMKIFIQH